MGVSAADLRAAPLDAAVTEQLEGRFEIEGLPYMELRTANDVDVLSENLRVVLRLPGVSMKQVAADLNMSLNTVSRWARGEHCPHPHTLRALVGVLHLPQETDLRTDPLFLLDEPFTHEARLEYLRAQLRCVSPDRLAELFPALTCLLRSP